MKKQNGITLIALVISIIVMLILAGVSINAVVGDNGVIGKAQETLYLQSCAVLEEFLQMEASNYALEENPYKTQYGLLRTKHPGWFYQNAQGYILDSDGHVMYLIKKSGLPQEIQDQITGGDASKVSQYYKQVDVYGVTSDLQVYYCNNGTDTILGLTTEDLDKDNPLEIAYDEDSLLSKVINGTNAEGKANEALSEQDIKSIRSLTINTTEKLTLLQEFKKLTSLQKVYFADITIPTLDGIQYANNITEIKFTNCSVSDYSGMCGLTKLNKLYLIKPAGKNTDVSTLCSTDKGIATAEFSNLKYFGIVGEEQYIQSTSEKYRTERYNVTDISGLANLSKVTKEAIQYMYLQNLQLTSIASLADYKNVTVLRVESNALTTFEGIQNMSNLTYLFAPNLYSNETSVYTLGINETDTQNPNIDVLSYIYKDAEGKNNKLYYLDARDAKDLKWTSYLSTCNNLKYLYLHNATKIKDIDTIKNIVTQCGTNYAIAANFTLEVAANSQIINLDNQTISLDQFKSILKNNTIVKYLRLSGIKIINDGVELTNSTTPNFNDEINAVLITCSNIVHLDLDNLKNLHTIEFVKNMPELISIYLRNTSVITHNGDITNNGLELLNTYCNSLGTITLDNSNIDVTNIQELISKASINYTNSCPTALKSTNSAGSGPMLLSASLLQNLKNCTDLTHWRSYNSSLRVSISWIDFSKCDKLIYCSSRGYSCGYILGKNTKTFDVDSNPGGLDCTYAEKIEEINFRWGSINNKSLQKFCDSAKSITTLRSLNLSNNPDITNLEPLGALIDTGITSLNLDGHSEYRTMYLENLNGIENLTSLTTISASRNLLNDISTLKNLTNLKKVTLSYNDIVNIEALGELSNLNSLTISNNRIINIEDLKECKELVSINLSNNSVNSILALSNLNKLETINLQNNALSEIAYGADGKAYYTLTVLSDLNQKQDGSLKNLYLSGNNIEDFSMLQDSNLKWDAKSGW